MLAKSLLLLALSITALSLPSAPEALQKRDSNAWLASFPSDDGTCENKNIQGSRPEWTSTCIRFTATTDRIGGSWGAGSFAGYGFTAFDDDDCQGNVLYKDHRKGKEDGFCQPLDKSAQWDKWRSVVNSAY